MGIPLSKGAIIGISVGVVAAVVLIIGLSVGLTIGKSEAVTSSTEPPEGPTRTDFLVNNATTKDPGDLPATITGSFQTFLEAIDYNETNPNNVCWFATNNLTGILQDTQNVSGTRWNYSTPGSSNTLPIVSFTPATSVPLDISVWGVGFNPSTELDLSDNIICCFSYTGTITTGASFIDFALPITLDSTDFVTFAQNADSASQPNLIVYASFLTTTNNIRIGYYNGAAGSARINVIVFEKNTTARFSRNAVYADKKTGYVIDNGIETGNIILSNGGVSKTGKILNWIGQLAQLDAVNTPYVLGVSQPSTTAISVGTSCTGEGGSYTVNIICLQGVSGSFFTIT